MKHKRLAGTLATRRRRIRSAAVAVFALALLAGVPSFAMSDPLDPDIADLDTFAPSVFPDTPTAGFPFGVEGTATRSFPGWASGELYETTDGDRLLTTCHYVNCPVQYPEDDDAYMAHPRTRTFRYELFSEGDSYDSREIAVHERKLWIGLRGDFAWSPGIIRFVLSVSPGGTDLDTYVYDNGSLATSCDVYYSSCYTGVTAGHVYSAIIRDSTASSLASAPATPRPREPPGSRRPRTAQISPRSAPCSPRRPTSATSC